MDLRPRPPLLRRRRLLALAAGSLLAVPLWADVAGRLTSSAGGTLPAAPELAGIDTWLNSPPLSLAGLRGQVVLVDFWTHGCINCIRAMPAVVGWHEKYAAQGLAVIGIHTPEHAAEQAVEGVREAMRRHRIRYPVALDNRYETWKAFRNRFWPALYLIDRQGRIAFKHYGEGDYEEIEAAIQRLLAQ